MIIFGTRRRGWVWRWPLLWLAFPVSLLAAELQPPAVETSLPKPLAHWTFDDGADHLVVADASHDEDLAVRAERPMARVHAVHGQGIRLSGQHALRVQLGRRLSELRQVSFSAWVRPTDLGSYREIFRQECPERLLFSFQHGGSILSLGLNIGGYVECDAPVRAEQLLDGTWHHCVATFDGHWMRVYLDGREVGQLQRPGAVATNLSAPSFIGSLGGTSEFFQGDVDEVRIYRVALTGEQVLTQYQAGMEAIDQYMREVSAALPQVYAKGDSFAATLARLRERLSKVDAPQRDDVARLVLTRLKSDFAEEYGHFVALCEGNPLRLLTGEPAGERAGAHREPPLSASW